MRARGVRRRAAAAPRPAGALTALRLTRRACRLDRQGARTSTPQRTLTLTLTLTPDPQPGDQRPRRPARPARLALRGREGGLSASPSVAQ